MKIGYLGVDLRLDLDETHIFFFWQIVRQVPTASFVLIKKQQTTMEECV